MSRPHDRNQRLSNEHCWRPHKQRSWTSKELLVLPAKMMQAMQRMKSVRMQTLQRLGGMRMARIFWMLMKMRRTSLEMLLWTVDAQMLAVSFLRDISIGHLIRACV